LRMTIKIERTVSFFPTRTASLRTVPYVRLFICTACAWVAARFFETHD
jgi:hypothetical protein